MTNDICSASLFTLSFNFPIYFQFNWFFSCMAVWCVGCSTGAIKPKVEQTATATLFFPSTSLCSCSPAVKGAQPVFWLTLTSAELIRYLGCPEKCPLPIFVSFLSCSFFYWSRPKKFKIERVPLNRKKWLKCTGPTQKFLTIKASRLIAVSMPHNHAG